MSDDRDSNGYRSSLLKCDDNPIAHIKSRDWIAIKYGYTTVEIRDPNWLETFLHDQRTALKQRGVLLAPVPVRKLLITDNLEEIHTAMKRYIVPAAGSQKLPIMFLMDDDLREGEVVEHVRNAYQECIYIFSSTGSELKQMKKKGSFKASREWCDEFVKYCILEVEEELDFDPQLLVKKKQEVVFESVEVPFSMPDSDDDYRTRNYRNSHRGDADYHNRRNAAGNDPRSTTYTEQHSSHQANYDDVFEDNEERPTFQPFEQYADNFPVLDSSAPALPRQLRPPPRSDHQRQQLPANREYYDNRNVRVDDYPDPVYDDAISGNGRHLNGLSYGDHRSREPKERELVDVTEVGAGATCSNKAEEPPIEGVVGRDEIEDAITAGRAMSQNNLAEFIAGPFLFNRFGKPFERLDDNLRLLEMIYVALDNPDLQSEVVYESVHAIIFEMADTQLLVVLLRHYGCLAMDDDNLSNWAADLCDLLTVIMHIFLCSLNILNDANARRLNTSWNLYYELLNSLPKAFWGMVPQDRYRWLDESVGRIQNNGSGNKDERPAEAKAAAAPPYTSVSNAAPTLPAPVPPPTPSVPAYEPMWISSEKKPPPCDFRTLSHMPVKTDVHNPVVPYVRRSKTEGAYESADHYLDVQFRLLREDMISPLRDGIANHKRTGGSRYEKRMDDEGVSSDLAVFELQYVEGIQIKWHTGERLRYAQLTKSAAMHPAVLRHLKFGQVVCLSSDGFRDDIQIAVVAERDDDKLLHDGRVGLAFVADETIQKNRGYIMAEPSSYLESYQHVLQVIKSISRFAPIPLERYVVYCKKNIRLPVYMRLHSTEEELNEDAEVLKHYTALRTKEEAVRQKKLDSKMEKARSRRRFTYEETSSSSSDSDSDTWDTVEPILKRRYNVANESVLEKILIKGQKYNVATLEKDFKFDMYDESQRQALVAALTRELAIIQGPPGTGKTFIGVEIVRTMLENRDHFCIQKPILLVCYTNTALDQFLERIIDKVPIDMSNGRFIHNGPVGVRLGSKSDSEILTKANMMRKDVINDYKSELAVEEERKLMRARGQKRKESSILYSMAFALGASKNTMMSYDSIQPVMSPTHHSEFVRWARCQVDSRGEPLNLDEALACWLLDKSFAPEGSVSKPSATPTKNKRKTSSVPGGDSDSDFEMNKDPSNPDFPKDEDDEENDEITLAELFKKINLQALAANVNSSAGELEDEQEEVYEMDSRWDMAKSEQGATGKLRLFGRGVKGAVIEDTNTKQNHYKGFGQRQVEIDLPIKMAMAETSDAVLKARSLTVAEHKDIVSVFSITKLRRWELYAYWRKQLRVAMRAQLPAQIERFQAVCKKSDDAQLNMDAKIFGKCLIIGATTTGAAKSRKLLEKIGCKILLVEEAAEVLEAHILSAMLPSLEHAVFIGDHQQLRPNPAVFELAREYGLDISMFERMIKNELPFNTLLLQHRMNATITRSVVRPHFYNHLKDADSVHLYPPVAGMEKPLYFWSHSHQESVPYDSSSFQNEHEIKMVVGLAEYIAKQEVYALSDITIISTYSAQTEALRSAIKMRFGESSKGGPAIAVETVDSYQGRENKIIIVSLVRSLGDTIGFLSMSNRICVALTRAQHGMYVVGNLDHLSYCSHLWRSIGDSLAEEQATGIGLPVKCKTHGTVSTIFNPNDFHTKVPDGGCSELCSSPLPCKHSCRRKCHPVDDHQYVRCGQPCIRVCSNKEFKHPCTRLCFETCGECNEMVKSRLACGHFTTIPCSKMGEAVCHSRCDTLLACGHQCAEICGKECTDKCVEMVDVKHDGCGHTSKVPCNLARFGHPECVASCPEILPCGHQCAEKCGQECTFDCEKLVSRDLPCGHAKNMYCHRSPSDEKCEVGVERQISECGHTSMIPCFAGSDPSKCPQRCRAAIACGHKCVHKCGDCFKAGEHKCVEICGKIQPCAHLCSNRCGAPCGPCSASCLTSCSHQRCGSTNSADGPGGIAYNRSCLELCVMCPKPCDNICEHRSCSFKCWEVCDVKACEESCRKRLPCGHACLGMCSETCPRVCGTCNQERYLSTISMMDKKGLHRLIQLPCQHVFPVTYLDENVRAAKEKGEWPRCPDARCGRPLEKVQRYSKIIKKIVLDQYQAKEDRRMAAASEKSNLYRKLSAHLNAMEKEIRRRQCIKREHNRRDELLLLISDAQREIAANLRETKDMRSYWTDVVACITYLYNAYAQFVLMEVPRQVHDPVEMEGLVQTACDKGMLQKSITDALDAVISWLRTQLCSSLSGIIMPKSRFLLQSISFYMAIALLHHILNRKNLDLNPQQAKDLNSMAIAFRNCGLNSNVEGIYSRFANYIYDKVLTPVNMQAFWVGLDKLVLPPF